MLFLSSVIALLSWAIANKAQKAGRSWAAFFWLSAVVCPIIMGIIAVTLKPLSERSSGENLSTPSLSSSIEAKLLELHSLKEKGVISDQDYEEAKKKALDL